MDTGSEIAGFSLVEVLVAAALALFMVAAAAGLAATALRADLKANLASAMTDALLARAERLKSLPPEAGELAEGAHEETVLTADGRNRLKLSWTVEGAGPGLKKVALEARPAARAGAAAVLTLYISKELGFGP
jgi:Tfp pilus assembly protein PilV